MAALICSGCSTVHETIHDTSIDHLHIESGGFTYYYTNGAIKTEAFPKESPIDIKDGIPKTYSLGVPRELEFGYDIFGLKVRPFVGIRTFYIFDFGGIIGADENASLFGLNWRYKDLTIGPLIGVPWLNPNQTIYGAEMSIPVSY